MNLLVTGGAGFIGCNFIRYYLRQHPDATVLNADCLTYAGNLENLSDVSDNPRYQFHKIDITDAAAMAQLFAQQKIDAVVNFAAESHVDRSIHSAAPFLTTNVLGTQVLLDAARQAGCGRFLQVSTDEVYGSATPPTKFSERDPLQPSSPYAASKAAADLLVRAYYETHRLPVIITRCSNNYGPYQFPEKLIPLMVTNALEDKTLPVYGDGLQIRDWIAVEDHCRGIDLALTAGRVGEIYNFGGDGETTNLEIVRQILAILDKPESLIAFVSDRPGHDRRYAIDWRKSAEQLQWAPQISMATNLSKTVEWYRQNRSWWQRVRSGAYRDYYQKQYGGG